MSPITVRYTKLDLLRLGLQVALRNRGLRWMSLIVAVVVLVITANGHPDRSVIGVIATTLTMALFTLVYFGAMVIITLLSALLRNRKGSAAAELQTYSLSDQGLSRQSVSSETLLKWGGARSLRRSRYAIYVGASSTSYFILPRHAFSSDAEYESWWDGMQRLRVT